jgi:Ca2+-transporting ATPase
MVLTDDNFSSVVSAVDEGRRSLSLRNVLFYLLNTNIAELLALIASIAFIGKSPCCSANTMGQPDHRNLRRYTPGIGPKFGDELKQPAAGSQSGHHLPWIEAILFQ